MVGFIADAGEYGNTMNDDASSDNLFDQAATLQAEGRLGEAEQLCHRILDANPAHAPSVSLMGIVLCQTGRAKTGVKFIEKACDLNPTEAAYANNLGTAYTGLGRLDEALAAFRRAIAANGTYPQAHNNIGAALRPLGRFDEAAAHYAKAVELAPDYGEAWANYANVLMDLERIDEADHAARAAVRLRPNYAIAHNNLGTVLQRRGQYRPAIACFRRALDLQADYPDALSNMGEALKDSGQAAEALPFYRKSVSLSPDEPGMASNMLMAICNIAALSPQDIADDHKAWGRRFAVSDRVFADRDRDPDRRLRIGYVSADFRRHSVAYFLEPILRSHDKTQVEVFCYANMAGDGDSVTARLQGHADHWRGVLGLSDAALAAQIRADRIDVLVDLAGHTRANRLQTFALSAAPVQMTYLGYPATTGLDAVHWRLTDAWSDPPGMTEAYHSERLLRLPNGFLCYHPDDTAPDVSALPMDDAEHVTFGSFNNLSKLTPPVIEAWAAILTRVRDSRLVLKAKALGDEETAARIIAAFVKLGIDADRLTCLAWITDGSPLAAYSHIDMGLDTFPYNGTTTTCEALWMGVPIIGLAGDWHAARVGVSLLSKIGLTDWIASDPAAYVDLAVEMAGDPAGLRALRAGLRNRVTAAGLTDGRSLTSSLEQAYRQAWQSWLGRDLS